MKREWIKFSLISLAKYVRKGDNFLVIEEARESRKKRKQKCASQKLYTDVQIVASV